MHGKILIAIFAVNCFIVSTAFASFSRSLDFPVSLFLNQYASKSVLFDKFMFAVTSLDLLQGVPLVALIWLAWFNDSSLTARQNLSMGVIGASVAGVLSRIMQFYLPFSLRPLHDPFLGFKPPIGFDVSNLSHWSSFPSDHAALMFGLATAIATVRLRVGLIAFVLASVVCFARIYGGLHFLFDIISGASLGVVIVCIFQFKAISRIGVIFPKFARKWPGAFYGCAFVATYLIATLFDDVRSLGVGFFKVMH